MRRTFLSDSLGSILKQIQIKRLIFSPSYQRWKFHCLQASFHHSRFIILKASAHHRLVKRGALGFIFLSTKQILFNFHHDFIWLTLSLTHDLLADLLLSVKLCELYRRGPFTFPSTSFHPRLYDDRRPHHYVSPVYLSSTKSHKSSSRATSLCNV